MLPPRVRFHLSLEEMSSPSLPEFCARDPGRWFDRVEQHFAAWNVNHDNAQFIRVLGALPAPIWNALRAQLRNPPPTGSKYQFAKGTILRELSPRSHRGGRH